jgi:hypothetical protein
MPAAVSVKYFLLINHDDAACAQSKEQSMLLVAFWFGAGGIIRSVKSVAARSADPPWQGL